MQPIPFETAMSQPASFWIRHAALVFALRTFAAAMLVFAIALRLDMPRPYWATASVYITSTQLTGATCSKAVYRMLGTLIGAAGVIALIPNLVDAPELLSFAIALWVGICLYVSLIDGAPRSYLFMLSGYTVALLGFPVLSMPELTFDIVVARVQEIMLGIICASVVSMLVLPRSVVSAIAAQADAWLAGARRLGVDVLTASGSDRERDNERMRLAAAASEIDQLWRHLGYETATSAKSHAASSGPACRADHRGSRRGTEQRRQSSPASSSPQSRRSQAGELCPVTPHKSGDRRFPCSPCFGLPDPPRRPASEPTGRTARQHDRIDIARAGERAAQ
jgi:hypothetical protein